MSPIKIENALGIHLWPSGNDELDAYLKKIRESKIRLMTIETLSINPYRLNKPWNFDWILSFRNLKKLTITGVILDFDRFDPSYMFDVLKKINGMKMIQLANCSLQEDFFDQFLKQFPPGHSLIIDHHCMISIHITSLLEILTSLGEMKAQKNLKIDEMDIRIGASLVNDLDKEKTKEILKKAQEIIDEKFDELDRAYINVCRPHTLPYWKVLTLPPDVSKYGFYLLKEKGKLWQKNYI